MNHIVLTFYIIFVCVCNVLTGLPSVCPKIVSKSDWGGRRALHLDYCIIPLDYVIVHHTVTPECTTAEKCVQRIRNMQDYHMDTLKYRDIGYNFLAGGDGKIYEGLGWHKAGAHTLKYNNISMGIAFIGDFTKKLPNDSQLKVVKDLLECGLELGELSENFKLLGGRQVRPTSSPGQKLYEELQKWRHYSSSA